MPNKMLIDATHPEETRVVVVRGNRVEEFDFESASRKPLRGNIYLAKVTRVEPSLQAAFVEYGGNRHGFLAFSEIHPDYYQIPTADRLALIEDEERAAKESQRKYEDRGKRRRRDRNAGDDSVSSAIAVASDDESGHGDALPALDSDAGGDTLELTAAEIRENEAYADSDARAEIASTDDQPLARSATAADDDTADASHTAKSDDLLDEPESASARKTGSDDDAADEDESDEDEDDEDEEDDEEEQVVEQVGGADAFDEVQDRPRFSHRRHYKIQEVIKRRQILLVQVVKEERGTKGAALTTYLSLAGRYSVLMPNTARGGGISRKITSAQDRKRLKELVQDLEVPDGMGVILRTAGASRTKMEIKRDFEYLMRLWESVRELTLESSAPALVYEEGSLIKRSIRDLYSKDIEEINVAGDEGCREAKDFMRMLMPSHARQVKQYRDSTPLFTKFGVEPQLDAMFSNQVTLKSGGYLVINQAEALVAIDVNSGRSTREHNIEDTALKTNLEAADEVARQLRLRDLAGLIVIDFIDMEERRNNRHVEKRLKDALKNDRARIQIGRISPFGLLEMSRQRMRTGVVESSSIICPHCGGGGHVRSTASIALQVLRMLEDQLVRGVTHNLIVRANTQVAIYLLNSKRNVLQSMEDRFGAHITITPDDHLGIGKTYVLEKSDPVPENILRAKMAERQKLLQSFVEEPEDDLPLDDEIDDEIIEAEAVSGEDVEGGNGDGREPRDAQVGDENGGRKRRRRRRRRGGRNGEARTGDDNGENGDAIRAADGDDADDSDDAESEGGETDDNGEARAEGRDGDDRGARRRRGRRGGRRNRRDRDDGNGETLDANGNPVIVAKSDIDNGDGAGNNDAPFVGQDIVAPTTPDETAFGAQTYQPRSPQAAGLTAEDTSLDATPHLPVATPVAAAEPEAPAERQAPRVPVTSNPDAYKINQAAPDGPKRGGWWAKAKDVLSGK
ncbi:MAG: Rne/Rng family ribonuclease [Beijerinckiaceae bacterium]